MNRSLLALCLLLSASICMAAGFPYIDGNTYKQGRRWPLIDTIAIPINRARGVYLVEPTSGTVRAGVDSILEVWRNGGAVPKFRKIQHLSVWNSAVDEEQIRMTIFDVRGTSHFRWVNQGYRTLDLPLEADSIQFQGDPFQQLDLTYMVW